MQFDFLSLLLCTSKCCICMSITICRMSDSSDCTRELRNVHSHPLQYLPGTGELTVQYLKAHEHAIFKVGCLLSLEQSLSAQMFAQSKHMKGVTAAGANSFVKVSEYSWTLRVCVCVHVNVHTVVLLLSINGLSG